MLLNFDFASHQSLGNLYADSANDNYQLVEKVKALMKSNFDTLEKTIKDILYNPKSEIVIGSTISIPVGHYQDSLMLGKLEFEVVKIDENEVNLRLINVTTKR